jgi:hypothetical protein
VFFVRKLGMRMDAASQRNHFCFEIGDAGGDDHGIHAAVSIDVCEPSIAARFFDGQAGNGYGGNQWLSPSMPPFIRPT